MFLLSKHYSLRKVYICERCKVKLRSIRCRRRRASRNGEQACSEFRAFASDEGDAGCIEVAESNVVSDKRFASRHISVRTVIDDYTCSRRIVLQLREVCVKSASHFIVRQHSETVSFSKCCWSCNDTCFRSTSLRAGLT